MSPRIRTSVLAALLGLACPRPAEAAAPGAAAPAGDPMALAIEAPRLPGRLEAGSHFYLDDHGLYVSTTGAEVEHPLGGRLALRLRALADWIGIYPPDDYADEHAHHLPGGHHHDPGGNPDAGGEIPVDAVSGASARAGSGGSATEMRGEGGADLVWRGRHGGRPARVSLGGRGSWEPDYQSGAILASGSAEAFQGNTVFTSHAGFGIDRIDPDPSVTVRGEAWPALQGKVSLGAAVSQLLGTRLTAGTGFSAAWLQGRLSSAYRRALVVTTLFPERLPDERFRFTGFAQGAYYLGLGAALHSRQGFYLDSWETRAWIPETALAMELGPRLLLTLRHRAYVQRPSAHYRTAYTPRDRYRTGDLRLGGLEEHTGAVEADWRLPEGFGGAGPLVLTAGYAYSRLEYWSLPGHDLTSQVFRLGAVLDY